MSERDDAPEEERAASGPEADGGSDEALDGAPTASTADTPHGDPTDTADSSSGAGGTPAAGGSRRAAAGSARAAARRSSARAGVTEGKAAATPSRGATTTEKQGIFARMGRFFREVVAELRKVIWPTRNQMITYTIVVIIFVTFMVALVAGLDVLFAKAVFAVFG